MTTADSATGSCFDPIPDEIVEHILLQKCLLGRDLLNIGQCSRRLNNISQSSAIWKKKFRERLVYSATAVQWKLGLRPPLFSGQLANTAASFVQSRFIFPLDTMYHQPLLDDHLYFELRAVASGPTVTLPAQYDHLTHMHISTQLFISQPFTHI